MGSRPVATATDRFKALLANALERVCILEAELEAARARIAELERADADGAADGAHNGGTAGGAHNGSVAEVGG